MGVTSRRLALTIGLALLPIPLLAQAHPGLMQVRPGVLSELREWDARVTSMLRDGDLRERRVFEDTLLPGRQHERLDQYYRGVKVFGADVVRQIAGGQTISVFGVLYSDINLDTVPGLSEVEAKAAVEKLAGVTLGPSRTPELGILPRDGGGYALTYRARAATEGDITVFFLDANTGMVVMAYSDLQTQSAVGKGIGVLGDSKKLSVRTQSGTYQAHDVLRPPAIDTYDMKGNLTRVLAFLNNTVTLGQNDLASDADNDWRDGAAVDAHAYAGFTYDYYYKRFGRAGLDNRNMPMMSLVHPVRREDIFTYPSSVISLYYVNAFYAGGGVMVYGEGIPPGYTLGGQFVDYQSGALDVVAHELSHGVTDFTSDLIYRNESGALNESFSDVMATGVEFFFQEVGSGTMKADYLVGEDTWRPGGIRSLANPQAFDDPDHYSRRYTGTADNGGVHSNSGISNHAFYLAIEGGTNRTSGLSVQGVGSSSRDQIEKVFYRAFTQLLPQNATFSMARAACEQAARDLYGASSAAFRAVQQAWIAVGVN
jgi:thermolysin